MTPYLWRELGSEVKEALDSLPVVVVSGLRQAGKTTFLQNEPALAGRRFATLDEMGTLERARRDPQGFVDSDEPLTIDEAQFCPELFNALKRAVDRKRRNGQFLISGSANFLLLRSITESLAGRSIYLTLHPLTHREKTKSIDREPCIASLLAKGNLPRSRDFTPVTDEDVLTGGMPPVALGVTASARRWFEGYERTYLERDVRELSQVADLIDYRRVMKLAAHRTGQMSNWTAIANEAKLPTKTATRYLDLLEVSYVTTRLAPFLSSRKARLVKTPKLYVSDSGLAAHLCEVDDLSGGARERLRGPLYETFVAHNLRAILEVHARRAELGFWNVQGRHEVDFVISTRKSIVAIEVKASPRFDDGDLAGLRSFASGTDNVQALVLAYQGREAISLGDKVFAVPIGLLLS